MALEFVGGMNDESRLSTLDFHDQLRPLEAALARGEAGMQHVFGGLGDDLFAYLLHRDFDGFPLIKAVLPDWPSDETRQDSTGSFTAHESLKEALYFWKAVKAEFESVTGRKVAASRVADYGAGWGRITRLCAKDVVSGSLFAFEPNPGFCDLFVTSRVEAELVRTDWLSEQPLPIRDLDLVICFSIFTHTSDRLARNVVARFTEITRPGSMIALTVRPGAFLHGDDGEMVHFSELERREALADFERGRLVYKPYTGSPDWGVTVAPMSYLRSICGSAFTVSGPHMFFQNWTQMIVFLTRNQT